MPPHPLSSILLVNITIYNVQTRRDRRVRIINKMLKAEIEGEGIPSKRTP
jgi:hypothetical protein